MLDSNKMNIDTRFNFQAALANPKRDANKCNVVLQDYHHFLWSKPLPSGEPFQLEKLNTACRLRYSNPQGDLILSSDPAVATFTRWKRLQRIISQVPQSRLDEFVRSSGVPSPPATLFGCFSLGVTRSTMLGKAHSQRMAKH
jgi:hypothetical protein